MTVALSAFDVLLVPGLHDSGPRHWQTLWQHRHPTFARVVQDDWETPDLTRWSERLQASLRPLRRQVLLVAHSFGCHINAESQLGDCHFGQAKLQQLAEMASSPLPSRSPPARAQHFPSK